MLHKFQDLQTSDTMYVYIYMVDINLFKRKELQTLNITIATFREDSKNHPVNTVYLQQNSNGESLYQRKDITFILPF